MSLVIDMDGVRDGYTIRGARVAVVDLAEALDLLTRLRVLREDLLIQRARHADLEAIAEDFAQRADGALRVLDAVDAWSRRPAPLDVLDPVRVLRTLDLAEGPDPWPADGRGVLDGVGLVLRWLADRQGAA